MKRLLATVMTALVTSTGALIGFPFVPPANAQTETPIEMEVMNITPSMVDGPGEVTVSGLLTNTSGTALNDVEARLERGNAVTDTPSTETALRGEALRATEPDFNSVTDVLAPGDQVKFELKMPVSGPRGTLEITEPGTYPLVVNVNGTPTGGARARIADANFLLPVVSTKDQPAQPPARRLPTTLIVPFIDYPRIEDLHEGTPVLTDDQLGSSLSPGGRLFELANGIREEAKADTPVGSSLCFAIDPDLLVTVDSMQSGYQVRQSGGGTRAGEHAEAAKRWLDTMRDISANRCIMATPHSDSDVVALSRAQLPDLVKGSMDGSATINEILNVTTREDVFWPIDGALDEQTAAELSRVGVDTTIMSPAAVDSPGNTLAPATLNAEGSPLALPSDPLLASALNPSPHGPASAMTPKDDGLLSAQNTVGALAFRAKFGSTPDSTAVLTPPRRWNLRAPELKALLGGMKGLHSAGYIDPVGMPENPPPDTPRADLDYPDVAAAREIPQPLLHRLARENFKVGDLYRSSRSDPAANVEPGQVTTPLRNALLRATSSAWRANPPASTEWLNKGSDRLAGVLSQVQVDIPDAVTLTASNSPIFVKVRNDLPITVKVKLRTPQTSGIKIKPLGELWVPQGGRSFFPGAELQRAGRFTVDITATTVEGTKLGSPKRLQVESTEYGAFTLVLTGAAGALLVVLSAVRITYRWRERQRRARADAATDEAADGG